MKKHLSVHLHSIIFPLFTLLFALLLTSCSDDEEYRTFTVGIQLVYPEGGELSATEGVAVTLTGNGMTYEAATDAAGACLFVVPNGIYEACAADRRAADGYAYVFNGIKSGIAVTDQWTDGETVTVELTASKAGQIIIKELYCGGCQKDDGSGFYQYDKYVILYNNSDQTATLDNLCLGMADPYNANASTNNYVNGELSYAKAGYTPAINGIWYSQNPVTIEPGQQITIAMTGAIDHTASYSNSVDLSNADFCTYDIEDYSNTAYYPSPSEKIPTDRYMLAYKYGQGNAWPLSVVSPAFYIFTTKDTTPEAFASNPDYHYTAGKEGNAVYRCAKVPNEWILDGIEVFSTNYKDTNKKRLTPDIDSGSAMLTNKLGHTLYRNVDQKATEGLPENAGKLVYGYSLGVEGATDPSGIDAEASTRNGARIIYQDTNNSTNDFHERSSASLKK